MWRKEEKELGLQSLKDCSQQPTSSLFSTLHSKYESLDGVLEESWDQEKACLNTFPLNILSIPAEWNLNIAGEGRASNKENTYFIFGAL